MKAPHCTGESLTGHLKPGDRVFTAGLSGESALVRMEFEQYPDRAAGVEFTAVQLPGVDRNDYLAIHPESRTRAFFMTPALRTGLAQRRAAIHPLDYSGICRHLTEAPAFDSVIAQFSLPDEQGWCSPGMTADFTPIVWHRAKQRIAHLNPRLPRLDSSFRVHISEIDIAVEREAPLLTLTSAHTASVGQQVASHAARLVRDGDTLQFGIGSVLPDVANGLHAHRGLRVHSGMVSPFIQGLWENGALDRDAPIITGVVFGDEGFYDYAARLGRLQLEDIRTTHNVPALARIDRFVAINSAVEVDLFGQINSERSDGTIHAGAGGLPSFAAATQLSTGGRLIICITATAAKGKISRIVPSLGSDSMCTLPRHLADAVVTEFGAAELRGLSMEDRAEALIAIAHPDHRATLASSWENIRKKL